MPEPNVVVNKYSGKMLRYGFEDFTQKMDFLPLVEQQMTASEYGKPLPSQRSPKFPT